MPNVPLQGQTGTTSGMESTTMGFIQTHGLDCQENFFAATKVNCFWVLLSLIPSEGWTLYQIDVKHAFLHGDLSEELYVCYLPGFSI